ncbi:UNC-like C-terminal-domain-containing protein, partial [Mycena olivaceomarginata]
RPDFALYSSGGSVIPSLTSQTYMLRPPIQHRLFGYLTGSGVSPGRPPVTALHHDIHDGHCWPFAGSQGQLGIVLASPIYIDTITINHVAAAVAVSRRTSAPRDMELWAMVEGQDNIGKLKAWRAYDIHSPDNIQTFPIDAEIRSLGINFGLVVLMVKNNWGMDKYTCLYRVQVHGQRMDTP